MARHRAVLNLIVAPCNFRSPSDDPHHEASDLLPVASSCTRPVETTPMVHHFALFCNSGASLEHQFCTQRPQRALNDRVPLFSAATQGDEQSNSDDSDAKDIIM